MREIQRIVCGALIAVSLALAASPVEARFVSVDPVPPDTATAENFNRYHYANDNPYRFTDPDGRQAKDMVKGAFRIVHGLIKGPPKPPAPPAAPKPNARVDVPAERAGHNGVEGPPQVVQRITDNGDVGAQVRYPDGSMKDVSPARVKEYVPQAHPNAPAGTMQRVKFDAALPGTKGLKRNPEPQDFEDAGLSP